MRRPTLSPVHASVPEPGGSCQVRHGAPVRVHKPTRSIRGLPARESLCARAITPRAPLGTLVEEQHDGAAGSSSRGGRFMDGQRAGTVATTTSPSALGTMAVIAVPSLT